MSIELVTWTYLDLYNISSAEGKVLLKKYSKQGLVLIAKVTIL